jgi:hypothetical protein
MSFLLCLLCGASAVRALDLALLLQQTNVRRGGGGAYVECEM